MKKLVSVISCLALLLSMTACKGQSESVVTTDGESSSAESVSASSVTGGAESSPEGSVSESSPVESGESGSTSSDPENGSTSSGPESSAASSSSANSSISSKPTSSSTSSNPTSSSASSNPTSSSASSKPTSSSTSSKPTSSSTSSTTSSNPTPGTADKGVASYTYTITPLLAPFNEYFFVKTDNPDPESFRFFDKSSKYESNNSDKCISAVDTVFADIKYENSETGRVNGGYIFAGSYTDGGEVVLQEKKTGVFDGYWTDKWFDTSVKCTLPALKDDTDYLIDTYANKSSFFDNMDAVQKGFSSICLYSGSYIRGELYKAGNYWYLSNSPHADQLFYLQSPYSRRDNQSLFASAIYPYRYDSLGFPGKMGSVAKRLNSSATYKWDSYDHYLINVTYGGTTRSYGGQGNGKGQGIDKSNIKQYFTFGSNVTKITLESAKKLLTDYSSLKIPDDVPKTDALTWKNVYDTVGSGSWVRLTDIGSIFGSTGEAYAFLYQDGDGSNFSTDPSSSTGGEIYWGGDIECASNVWVDGRYVDERESFVKGAKFEDHPTSNIIIKDFAVPQVKYTLKNQYNNTSGQYERTYTVESITEVKRTVYFMYDKTDKVWTPRITEGTSYYTLSDLVAAGALDKKYLDMVTLTLDEVKAMKVDRNTNTAPADYYIYDGTAKPGTKNH